MLLRKPKNNYRKMKSLREVYRSKNRSELIPQFNQVNYTINKLSKRVTYQTYKSQQRNIN